MSRSGRHKDKYGNSKEQSRDDIHEGTAARTRPFSFEEIMLRRKQKKLSEEAKVEDVEPRKLSGVGSVEVANEQMEDKASDRKKKGSSSDATKNVSRGTMKELTRNKEVSVTKRDGEITKHKPGRDSEVNLKVKSSKDKSIADKGDKSERRSHHRSRTDERKSEFENELEKKRVKDFVGKYVEKDKTSQRESKRKHHSGNDDKSRFEADASAYKWRDSGKWIDKEYSERKGRKKESSHSHHEEGRSKRRRSRSREHVRERDRRSISLSPRAHKRVSYHGREHEESSHHSSKDRSARHDKNRVSSNGGHGSGHYRRHGGHSSGLGGYSPRKRRTEAAIRTPSPTIRSPERKNASWDIPPPGTDKVAVSSSLASIQSVNLVTTNSHELLSSEPLAQTTQKPQALASPSTILGLMTKTISGDSIQLTQATQPMRRLFVENVPPSASDKAIVECFNDFFLSLGVSHIKGTQPCISCIINKEKAQALVEFLTPVDATSALSFNGRSFFGSILKIRRPKDFVETAGYCIGCVIIHIQDGEARTSKRRFPGVMTRFSDSCYFHADKNT